MSKLTAESLCDPAAEMAVLSACYNNGEDSYLEIVDIVEPASFTVEYNELFFVCMKHIFENMKCKKPDIATLNSAAVSMNLLGLLSSAGCSKHIGQIVKYPTRPENVPILAAKLRRLQIARNIKSQLEATILSVNALTGDESLSDMFRMVESPIFNLSNNIIDQNDPCPLGKNILDYVNHKIENPGIAPGLSSGYKAYDAAIGGGLRYGSTNYIGARIKNFKSGFALNVANFNAKMGIPVLYLDTELQEEEQFPRLLANQSGVSIDRIECGDFTRREFELLNIKRAAESIHNSIEFPLYHINISRMEFQEHLSILRRWVHKVVGVSPAGIANPCLVIYDYIKLVHKNDMRDMSEHQAIGFIATGLQNFALRYKIPIMVFSQLNRDGISKESSDIVAQSDRVMWFCSNFCVFKEKSDEEYADDSNGNYKLVPIVARHGKKLKSREYINFSVDGDHFRITERGLNTAPISIESPTDVDPNTSTEQVTNTVC